MSFETLPIEMKSKILEMLNIGDGYNASLVWEEMADEIWRYIPTDLIEQWKPRYGTSTVVIDNLYDFDESCVYACVGLLDSGIKRNLNIINIDLSSVPINIVKCLATKVERLKLMNVAGFSLAMLEETLPEHFRGLGLDNVTLHVQEKQEKNHKLRLLDLDNLGGDVREFFNSISFDHMSELSLGHMKIPQQVKRIKAHHIYLNCLSGDIIGLLDNITCDTLTIEDMKLSNDETRSLIEMMKDRVRVIKFEEGASLDCSLLTNYHGQGLCEAYDGQGHCEAYDGQGHCEAYDGQVHCEAYDGQGHCEAYDGQGRCEAIMKDSGEWDHPQLLEISFCLGIWAENVGWTEMGIEDEGFKVNYKRL